MWIVDAILKVITIGLLGTLLEGKRIGREAPPRYTTSKWFKNSGWCKKVIETAINLRTTKNTIRRTLCERYESKSKPINLEFFKNPLNPMESKRICLQGSN